MNNKKDEIQELIEDHEDQMNKIEKLKNKIDKYDSKEKLETLNSNKKGAGFGFKISTEIVAAIAVGVVIGMIVDNYFNTKPFGLIIFFILGALAGFLNVYRVMRRIEKQ